MYIYIVSTANELMNYFKENRYNMLNIYKTSIFSEKISPANDCLFVLDGLFVHEGLYVYVQLTYKKAWIFWQLYSN